MGFHEYPYTDLYNLNLDWMLKIVKQYADTIDDIPAKVKDAVDKLGDNLVLSVNGESGNVVLYKDQYTRLPDIEEAENPVWNFYRKVNGVDTGLQFLTNGAVELIVGTNRYRFYTDKNPVVESFNNRTGAVNLTTTDINRLRMTPVYNIVGTIDDYSPAQLASLYEIGYRFMVQRDAQRPGFSVMYFLQVSQSGVTSATPLLTESGQTTTAYSPENPPPYPVKSVNAQQGDVNIVFPEGLKTTVTVSNTAISHHSFNNDDIKADMTLVYYEITPENSVKSDIVVTTENGSFTIDGTFSESCTLNLTFMEV